MHPLKKEACMLTVAILNYGKGRWKAYGPFGHYGEAWDFINSRKKKNPKLKGNSLDFTAFNAAKYACIARLAEANPRLLDAP